MKSAGDILSYLSNLELTYEEPREGTWVVRGVDGIDNLIITLAGPVVVSAALRWLANAAIRSLPCV